MIVDILKGFLYYFRSLPYLTKGRLTILAFAPGLVAMLIGIIYIYGVYSYADEISAWVFSWYPWDQGEQTVELIGSWVTLLIFVVVYFLLLKYIILIVGGPFMSPFSERIEQLVSGNNAKARFNAKELVGDIIRGLRINVRNLVKEISITLVLLLLSFIPGVATITSVLIFLVGAYYAGFGNMDFTLERHFGYKGSIEFVKRNRGVALGNGIIFMLIFSIPIIGVLVAPPLATASSTLHTLEKLNSLEGD